MQSKITMLVTRLIEPLLTEMKLELVEVLFQREPIGMVLRLIIHKKGGVGLDDCTLISREVAHLLEVEDLIESPYHLEVSSPGLDRPLKTKRDFERNRNNEIKVIFNDSPGQQVTGTIIDATEDTVSLQLEDEQLRIPLDKIAKATLVF